jgi:UDP-glucuronate 4-epimerase
MGPDGDPLNKPAWQAELGMQNVTTLVTGGAGFIGFHLSTRLLAAGHRVVGIDNLNPYYDPQLKRDRVAEIERQFGYAYRFIKVDFADRNALETALANVSFDRIAHLGAQAGVRYSIENPHAYVESNLVGHINLLEMARHRKLPMVYASSSSVYGSNKTLPFRVDDRVDHPMSLYAATKKANELMSECYAHLYRIPLTGLRFFTVYGPWGRPDMAMWIFAKAIMAGEPIKIFNQGEMRRDFTFIDDIVSGVVACLDNPPPDDGLPKAGGSVSPHRLYNIGNNSAEDLTQMIALIEDACGRSAIRELHPMQDGDVKETFADIDAIANDLGYRPTTKIEAGIPKFIAWYKAYHNVADAQKGRPQL